MSLGDEYHVGALKVKYFCFGNSKSLEWPVEMTCITHAFLLVTCSKQLISPLAVTDGMSFSV